jgi:cation:H+ antiporter
MITAMAALLAGGALLFFGGNWLVDGAVDLARRLRISSVLVAIFVVGFGTSLPELVVSVTAVTGDADAIAMGNVVGSNIANLLFVLAASALILPITIPSICLRLDGLAMGLSAALLAALCVDGALTWLDGLILCGALLAFVFVRTMLDGAGDEVTLEGAMPGLATAGAICGGLLALPLGAHLFVFGGVELARALGVSEAVIGLSVVALGTSLPEFATCIAAAVKRQSGVIVGNILGSNVFNSTLVIGGAALAGTISVDPIFTRSVLWIMIFATALSLFFMWTGARLNRAEGLVMLALYIGGVAGLAWL